MQPPLSMASFYSIPSVHLTIMSLVGRSRHDFETQAREECELGFCPTVSNYHVVLSPKAPVAMSLTEVMV